MSHELKNIEKLNSLNELTGLVQCLVHRNTLIDLRNETSVAGTIVHVDGFMNITMENVVYIDQLGKQFPMDTFMIYPQYIRYVHIPKGMNIRHAIQEHIASNTAVKREKKHRTFKQKRAQDNQLLTLAENNML
ncbi:U7 snRNA-associated Sm-like protein LSm10 [Anopheles bellator]|uniref:U7 snRNA-associated Sm-like protein LSm10 n=1 Tax=Anopheles bellator TaxID=139047 RepID=UPI0026482ABE|nr:U7 snRNA-associated Sm-like protein LSm10 [Anopheles bellator]